jgi:hypothetical protein
MKEHPEPWADDEWEEYSRLFPGRMEEWIDAGNGECLLECPEISKIVAECLWQDESFDHIVRSAAQLDFYRKYIAENPDKAKLAESRYLLGSGIGLRLKDSSRGGLPVGK